MQMLKKVFACKRGDGNKTVEKMIKVVIFLIRKEDKF